MSAGHTTLPNYTQNRNSNIGTPYEPKSLEKNGECLKEANFNSFKTISVKNNYNIRIDRNKETSTVNPGNNSSENHKAETLGSKHRNSKHEIQGVKLIVRNEKLPVNSHVTNDDLIASSIIDENLNLRKKLKSFNHIFVNHDNSQSTDKNRDHTSSTISEKKINKIRNKKRIIRIKNKNKRKLKKASENKNKEIKTAPLTQTDQVIKLIPINVTDVPKEINVNPSLLIEKARAPNEMRKFSTIILIAKAINLYLYKEKLTITYNHDRNNFSIRNIQVNNMTHYSVNNEINTTSIKNVFQTERKSNPIIISKINNLADKNSDNYTNYENEKLANQRDEQLMVTWGNRLEIKILQTFQTSGEPAGSYSPETKILKIVAIATKRHFHERYLKVTNSGNSIKYPPKILATDSRIQQYRLEVSNLNHKVKKIVKAS